MVCFLVLFALQCNTYSLAFLFYTFYFNFSRTKLDSSVHFKGNRVLVGLVIFMASELVASEWSQSFKDKLKTAFFATSVVQLVYTSFSKLCPR